MHTVLPCRKLQVRGQQDPGWCSHGGALDAWESDAEEVGRSDKDAAATKMRPTSADMLNSTPYART
jgi:hypothetical protein